MNERNAAEFGLMSENGTWTETEPTKKMDQKQYYRFKNMLRMIQAMCELSDFEVEGRIALRDKKSGRIWR